MPCEGQGKDMGVRDLQIQPGLGEAVRPLQIQPGLGRQSGLWRSDVGAESWNGIFQAEVGSQVRREMVQHLDMRAGGFISDPGEG